MNTFLFYDDDCFIIVYWNEPLEQLKKEFKKAYKKTIKRYNEQYPSCDFREELEWTLKEWIYIEWTKPLLYNDL